MSSIRRILTPFFAFLVFSVASAGWSAPIYKLSIADDRQGAVIARLYASFEMQANAARRWYTDALRGRHVDTAEFSLFSRPLETATFVSFTYTYQVDGEERTRVYHSRSGRNNLWDRQRSLRTSARVEDYYAPMSATVVALDQPAPEGSRVTESRPDGDLHDGLRKRDAELKVARQIELDILQHVIEPGGVLQGFSSQEPCTSCEDALEALSDNHNIPVHVTYLGYGSRAYSQFQQLRLQFLSTVHVAVDGGQMNLLNQEEGASGAPAHALLCLDEERPSEPRD